MLRQIIEFDYPTGDGYGRGVVPVPGSKFFNDLSILATSPSFWQLLRGQRRPTVTIYEGNDLVFSGILTNKRTNVGLKDDDHVGLILKDW